MALDAYLTLAGQKQGDIRGGVTIKGRENSLLIVATSHEVISPRDAASGLPSGKRQHHPFVITKPIDQASPLLENALVNNENITRWRLNYWRKLKGGVEEQHFTIELVNANIASIHQEMLNNMYDENVPLDIYEVIAFTYQKITWTWNKGGITASDDWETPVA